MGDILIFQTEKLYKADIIASALKEAHLPYYRRQKVGELELAMPLSPADWIGISWLVYVPSEIAEKAQTVIAAFPFNEENVQKIGKSKITRYYKILIIIILVITAIILCLSLIRYFR